MNNDLTGRQRLLIFINLIISGIASSTLSTALATAVPSMISSFGISTDLGQWITSGYFLAMGIIMPVTAFLIKRFPSGPMYTAGILIFIAGTVLCIFTDSFAVLMTGRVMEACGNGILLSLAQVVILTIYPDGKKGTMMGIYGMAATVMPIIAPTLAGLLIDAFGWRSIFCIILAIMSVSLIMSCLFFKNVLRTERISFDTVSFIETVFAFGGITLGLGNILSSGLFSTASGVPLLIGIITGILFVKRQLSLEKPFLDITVLTGRRYLLGVISSILLYFIMMGSTILMPLYVQSVMGRPAVISGLVTLPGSIATTLISPISGRIYDKKGLYRLFPLAAVFMMICNIGMFMIDRSTPLYAAAALNVLRCLSIGCMLMPLVTWSLSGIEESKMADASSLLTSFRTISGSIGSAVFVGIMTFTTAYSGNKYGDEAMMHGVNISYLCMAGVSVIILIFAMILLKNSTRDNAVRNNE